MIAPWFSRGRRTARVRALAFLVISLAASATWAATGPPDPTTQPGGPPIIALGECSTFICAPATAATADQTCGNQTWQDCCATLYQPAPPADPTQDQCYQINYNSWAGKSFSSAPDSVYQKKSDRFTDPATTQHYVTFSQPTQLGPTGTGTWAGQENKAKWDALQFTPILCIPGFPCSNPALSYIRPGIGDLSPTSTVHSCENYVYRSFYDVERWIDAVNACKGDARCFVTVTMNGMTPTAPAITPGIARRAISDVEGRSIDERNNLLISEGKLKTSETSAFKTTYALGTMAKNTFYSKGFLFITQNLINAFNGDARAEVQYLENELHRGNAYYVTGGAGSVGGDPYLGSDGLGHRGFYDEFDLHNTLNQWTAGVTDGQFREYRRRNDAIAQAVGLFADDLKCYGSKIFYGPCNGHNVPNALGKVGPGDTQIYEGDPFAVRAILTQINATQFALPPSVQGMVGFGKNLQNAALTYNQLQTMTTPVSGTTMFMSSTDLPGLTQKWGSSALVKGHKSPGIPNQPPPPPPDLTGPAPYYDPSLVPGVPSYLTYVATNKVLDQMWMVNPPRIDTSVPYPHLNCSLPPDVGHASPLYRGLTVDTNYGSHLFWQDACNLINLYLEEWGRTLEAKPSCLSANQFECDWSPKDFTDRFMTQFVTAASAAKEVEYRECKRWTAGGQLNNTNPKIGATASSTPVAIFPYWYQLGQLRSLFDARWLTFKNIFKNVPIQAPDLLGVDTTDSHTIGNQDFGGGYNYELGWDTRLYRQNGGDQTVCRSGATVKASFEAHATLFSNKLSILDAFLLVSSNDRQSTLGDLLPEDTDPNNPTAYQAYGNAHLKVIGFTIFDTKNSSDDPPGATPDAAGNIDLSGGFSKEVGDKQKSPPFFAVPFQVGWVTVTVSAGVAFAYSLKGGLDWGAPPAADCIPSKPPLFELKATVTPSAELDAWVDADVSLAGIIGVGVEINLQLVGISFPLTGRLWLAAQNVNDAASFSLNFDAELDLVLSTLKGELDFYIELFWTHIFTVKVFGWEGFKHSFPIFRMPAVNIPLFNLAGPICPIDQPACASPAY